MELRQATPADWPRIYRFWSTIVNAGETYAYPEGLTADQAEPLWMERPPAHTVVAVDGADVLGSAKMGPNRPGRGVGRQLDKYMIGWAGRQGYHAIQFNAVVETNVLAVRLWQALGFRILCTVPEAFDHHTNGLVGLHVMYRKI
jgi:GNAT superfamily N-acetyltransferase